MYINRRLTCCLPASSRIGPYLIQAPRPIAAFNARAVLISGGLPSRHARTKLSPNLRFAVIELPERSPGGRFVVQGGRDGETVWRGFRGRPLPVAAFAFRSVDETPTAPSS